MIRLSSLMSTLMMACVLILLIGLTSCTENAPEIFDRIEDKSDVTESSLAAYERGLELGKDGMYADAKKEFAKITKSSIHYEASKLSIKAIDTCSKDSLKYFFTGSYYYQSGMVNGILLSNAEVVKDAIKEYTNAIQLSPNCDVYYNSRGVAFVASKDISKGIADYDRALEINPNAYYSRLNKGAANIFQGNIEEAIKLISQVAEEHHLPEAYTILGYAYVTKGEFERGIEQYNLAIELDPSSNIIYINRGAAYYKIGNHEKACEDLEHACELGACSQINLLKARGQCS